MADRKISSPERLYSEGDSVKAKVLKTDEVKKQISFGLKASFFRSKQNNEENENPLMDGSSDDERSNSDEAQPINNPHLDNNDNKMQEAKSDADIDQAETVLPADTERNPQPDIPDEEQGLSTGFDWTGGLASKQF
ncbi:MAG: hypothetical protein Q9190_008033, partial [Brigantiaea leucoxantha]